MEADSRHASAIVDAAATVAKRVSARSILLYSAAIPDRDESLRKLNTAAELILLRGHREPEPSPASERVHDLVVPEYRLMRMDQIKMATLLAFSQRMLNGGDVFVALTGVAGKLVDTLVVMRVGEEYELFQSVDQPKLTEHVKRVVFQRVLNIALELAHEGREGRSVGALFVIGSARELSKHTEQNIINPFQGYQEKQRNILDERMRNTVKEFAAIDGAFIIKGNGVIVSAGTMLRPDVRGEELPQGLGARHAAAAAITAATKSIALTVSQSTGTVRLWRRGRMITELEKAPRAATRDGLE